MSDETPTNGNVRAISPAAALDNTHDAQSGAQPDDNRFDAAAALLRLLVGGALVGADELRTRLERWQAATDAPTATQAMEPWTASDSLRYALVGMLFETETRMRRGFSRMLSRVARASHEANRFYTSVTADMRRTPLDPLRMRLDETLYRATRTFDRWTDRGWIEERQSRRMAREATASVIDELLDYMARNPEVRQLIEEQGMSMAETAVDEVRERTATADMWIERIARGLLHRPVTERPAKPEDATSSSAASTAEATQASHATAEADASLARRPR